MVPEGRDIDLLNRAQVAALFRVDLRTVTRWAEAGKLPFIVTDGGHRRYRRAEIDRLLVPKVP